MTKAADPLLNSNDFRIIIPWRRSSHCNEPLDKAFLNILAGNIGQSFHAALDHWSQYCVWNHTHIIYSRPRPNSTPSANASLGLPIQQIVHQFKLVSTFMSCPDPSTLSKQPPAEFKTECFLWCLMPCWLMFGVVVFECFLLKSWMWNWFTLLWPLVALFLDIFHHHNWAQEWRRFQCVQQITATVDDTKSSSWFNRSGIIHSSFTLGKVYMVFTDISIEFWFLNKIGWKCIESVVTTCGPLLKMHCCIQFWWVWG